MARFVLLILALTLSCATPSGDSFRHVEERGETEAIPLSNSRLDAQLIEAAREYSQHGSVARIALFDLTLPSDQQEYDALEGFAVIVITVVAQDARELPPARAFVRLDGEESELTRLAGREGSVAGAPLVSQVLGRYRFDGLYLYPMAFRALGAQLVIDFARNRNGFVVATFPMTPEPDGFPVAVPSADRPDPNALRRLVAREIPVFSGPGGIQ